MTLNSLEFGCKSKTTRWMQFVLIWTLALLTEVSPQLVTDCNVIEPGHMATNGHSYCSHACRENRGGGGGPDHPLYTCQAGGHCNCAEPCFTGTAPPPQLPIANDLPCPNDDPANPGLTAACIATCRGACTGGTGGVLCGDTPRPPPVVRVCTCLCPPQPCPTTTTVAPVTIPAVVVVPAKVILHLKAKMLLLLKKIFVISWFLCKVYLLKVFLIFCWKTALHHYFGIDLDIDWWEIYHLLKWFLRSGYL